MQTKRVQTKRVQTKRTFVLNPNVRFENTYKYLHFIWAVKPQEQRKYKENIKPNTNQNMLI